ncbi:Leucine-rich repeat (LRR) protein [Bacilli bacterium PM5-3]|nr:Leucine-rich repeat (LRR) protein [Bacilli bacterium PM5-3]MDH6603845.1 Leucine-rich repeat (LRR) protein [Bacilli bacterium PM5-9]
MKYKNHLLLISLVFSMFLNVKDINALSNFEKCVNDNLKQQKTTSNKLNALNCQNYRIDSVSNLSKYPNLEYVDLSYNKIKTISSSMVSNKKIKQLKLNNNMITNVNGRISKLSNLEDLNLGGNTFYYLPVEINKLKKLKNLNLSATYLLELPSINNLTRLNTLNLESNQLFTLPNLKNNPINKLSINNNFLSVNKITTKTNEFKVNTQNKLKSNISEIVIDNKCLTYTPEELIQRNIVSNQSIPLYGIVNYYIYAAIDDKGSFVDVDDYINLSNCDILKDTNITGKIAFKLSDSSYNTNLFIKIVATKDKGSTEIIHKRKPNDLEQNNNSKDKKKDEDTLFKNINTFEYNEKNANNFYRINNSYLLSAILLLIVLIPLVLIARVINKIKNYSVNIRRK